MSTKTIVTTGSGVPKNKKNKGKSSKNPANQFGDIAVPRLFIKLAGQIYRIKRIVFDSNVSQVAGVPNLVAVNYRLSALPNAAEFTALFDQFRIDCVRTTFRPAFNAGQVIAVATALYPDLLTVIDLNDSNSPAALADMYEYQTLKVTGPFEKHSRCFKPKWSTTSYTGSFSGFAPMDGWVDCASSTTQWYGLKIGVLAGAASQTLLQRWEVQHEYYMSFRNVQ